MIYKIFLLFPIFIVIPIIIHLLSRKRIKEEFFPSLLFLYEREKKLRNYIKFEELILFIIRVLMILSLSAAGGLIFVPFNFLGKSELKKIFDTSLSMEGRIKPENYQTVNINGIADFEKTFEKYKFGIIVSDMQEVNFKSILKKNKKYRYFIPETIELPEENNSIREIYYSLDKNIKISVKIKRDGRTKKEKIVLFFDDKKFSKVELLNNGDNLVEFNINEETKGFHQITCMVNGLILFDNVYYKVVYFPEEKIIKILSDEEPKFLIKALERRFKIEWINDIRKIKKDDIVILENKKGFINIDYLSNICSKIILSVSDSIHISDIQIKKITDRYSNIYDEEMYIMTEEPLKYNFSIEGGNILVRFKNGDNAILKKGNILISVFSLQAQELVYHTYYLPFLYSLIEKTLTDFEINKEIGDTITGDFDQIITPDGVKYISPSEFVCERRGFYKIIKNNDTLFIGVNPRKEEYDLKILEKEKIDDILSKTNLYDGTSFFLFVFLVLLIFEKIMERR